MCTRVYGKCGCHVCECVCVPVRVCARVMPVGECANVVGLAPLWVCVGSACVQASPCLYWVPVFPLCPMAVLEEGVGVSGCGLGILQPLARLAKRPCWMSQSRGPGIGWCQVTGLGAVSWLSQRLCWNSAFCR